MAGLVKFPCKGEWRWENPELKITIEASFSRVPVNAVSFGAKKGVSGRFLFELGQGSMKKSYIMYMDA